MSVMSRRNIKKDEPRLQRGRNSGTVKLKWIHKPDCKLITTLLRCKRKIPPLNILKSEGILSKVIRFGTNQNLARTLNLPIHVLEIFNEYRIQFEKQIEDTKQMCTCTEESTSLTPSTSLTRTSCGSITVTNKRASQIICSDDVEASKFDLLVGNDSGSMSSNHSPATIEGNNSNSEQETHGIIDADNEVLLDGLDASNSGTFLESDISTAQGLQTEEPTKDENQPPYSQSSPLRENHEKEKNGHSPESFVTIQNVSHANTSKTTEACSLSSSSDQEAERIPNDKSDLAKRWQEAVNYLGISTMEELLSKFVDPDIPPPTRPILPENIPFEVDELDAENFDVVSFLKSAVKEIIAEEEKSKNDNS